MRAKAVPNRADLPAIRRSQASARPRPGAGHRAVDHADDDLRMVAHQQRQLMRAAQPLDPVLDGLVAAAQLHRLDVAAGAPAAPGPGNDDRAAFVVGRKPFERFLQPRRHRRRQRVEPLRPVQGQGRDAVFAGFEQVRHGRSPGSDGRSFTAKTDLSDCHCGERSATKQSSTTSGDERRG